MKTIKEARASHSLTQKQMATVLNTPLRTYIKWESGERRTPGIAFAMIFVVDKYKGAKAALLDEYT